MITFSYNFGKIVRFFFFTRREEGEVNTFRAAKGPNSNPINLYRSIKIEMARNGVHRLISPTATNKRK